MLKMSFYNGTLKKEEAITFIEATEKPCVYTYGLGYRNPTIHRKPIGKEKAIKIVRSGGLLDVTEENAAIHLNEYSDNDMW